jgi:threonine 3-dehydrogenase
MRALMKAKAEPGLTLTDVEVPEPESNEVRIRVKQVGICGTDLHIYNWDKWASSTIPVPMVVGHEFVGYIDALGKDVKGLKSGQRVSGEGHIICGTCRNCRAGREHFCRETMGVGVNRPGAFAEYLVIPQHNVYPIPDDVSDDFAALLDPYGNAVHTALGFDLVGEDVLITGAGPIGLMAAAICRHAGARHIVVSDVNINRLVLAERMGASAGFLAGRDNSDNVMKRLGMTEGFDIGLEMSGAGAALDDMINAMNNGGQIGLLGLFKDKISVDFNKAIFKGLRFKGIYGREMFDTWHKGLSMLQSGLDISPVITHKLPFENFEEGFTALNSGQALKVLLQFD